jgi:hypothetical protein
VRITFDVDLVARVSALAAYHRSRRSLSGWASVATEPLMLPSVAGDIVVDPGGRRARKSRSRRHLNHSPIARSSWPKKSECWLSRTKTDLTRRHTTSLWRRITGLFCCRLDAASLESAAVPQ